jgi:hypothetical protein
MVIKSNKPISHAYFYSSKCVVIQYWDRSCCNCIVNILQMVLWSKNEWVNDAIKLVYQSLKEHTFDFHKWVVQIFNTDLDSFPALCVGLQIWVSLDLFNVQIRSIFTSFFRSFFFKLIHPSHSLSPTYIKVLFLCCNYTSQHDDDSNLIQAVNRRKTYNIMSKRRRTKNGPQTLNRILKTGQHEHPLKNKE